MARQQLIELKHAPVGEFYAEYQPSYDLYFVKRTSDNEIVLRTSYRSEAQLYVGQHL